MRIHEAAQAVGCTQRAIKFYEEKKLLRTIARSDNGYREYSDEDIQILHAIQAYRKLGISVADIKKLLNNQNTTLLTDILTQKKAELSAKQSEIAALEAFISSRDAAQLNEAVDYATITQAIRDHLPGFFGQYLAHHFAPYLNIHIHTKEQKDAYASILSFWDNPKLKLPLMYKLHAAFSMLIPSTQTAQVEAQVKSMLSANESDYIRMRNDVEKVLQRRRRLLIRYSPFELFKRYMMRSLRDCGYYDIFIPQMKRLSPLYKAYHDALDSLNARLCNDLNLYYDSNYNLVQKK